MLLLTLKESHKGKKICRSDEYMSNLHSPSALSEDLVWSNKWCVASEAVTTVIVLRTVGISAPVAAITRRAISLVSHNVDKVVICMIIDRLLYINPPRFQASV